MPGELGKQFPVFLFCTYLGASFYVPGLMHTGTTCIWSSVQFSSVQDGINMCAWKSPCAFHPVSQMLPQHCLCPGFAHPAPISVTYVCLSLCLFIYLPVCSSIFLSTAYLFIYVSVYLDILYVFLSVCLSFCLPVSQINKPVCQLVDWKIRISTARFLGSLQVLTSTYKLNLPSKALQVLIFASQSLQI